MNKTLARLRAAQRGATGEKLASLNDLAADLNTPSIRYSQPELQTHIQYLYTLTNATDQKRGRDAIERYNTLRKSLVLLGHKVPEPRQSGIATSVPRLRAR